MDGWQGIAGIDETLDPGDWEPVRELSHRIMDDAIDHLRDVRERPVWREMPAEVRSAFTAPLPHEPTPLEQVYRDVAETVMPYPMGNVHPRFWSWYMGAGNFTGALGDFLAAVQGSNLGGGNHAAALMDRQVVDWCRQMVGFPEGSGGSLVSGGSMANLIALAVARSAMVRGAWPEVDVRELGVAALPAPLVFYASDQAHSCHRKAIEALGHGNRALRRIPTGPDLKMDLAALRFAIAQDRASGLVPCAVIATAGTVNTGAVDDLEAVADIAAAEGLWMHVDGCIGALVAIAPANAWRVAGLERADSVALDPHKWLHAPFEAGCVLVRDSAAHRAAFAVNPEYLETMPRGLAAAEWLYDYGLQTTRGFKALKIWMAIRQHGIVAFGRLIDQNIAQAHHLAGLLAAEPALELTAPVEVNIVCFRHRAEGLDAAALKVLNVEIMLRLQEQGTAALSDTTVKGEHCLRVAIANHRTRREDLDLLVRECVRIGREILDGR